MTTKDYVVLSMALHSAYCDILERGADEREVAVFNRVTSKIFHAFKTDNNALWVDEFVKVVYDV